MVLERHQSSCHPAARKWSRFLFISFFLQSLRKADATLPCGSYSYNPSARPTQRFLQSLRKADATLPCGSIPDDDQMKFPSKRRHLPDRHLDPLFGGDALHHEQNFHPGNDVRDVRAQQGFNAAAFLEGEGKNTNKI